MDGVWKVFGRCLDGVWKVSEGCLRSGPITLLNSKLYRTPICFGPKNILGMSTPGKHECGAISLFWGPRPSIEKGPNYEEKLK